VTPAPQQELNDVQDVKERLQLQSPCPKFKKLQLFFLAHGLFL
jgi:hypothetical protein